MFGIIKALGFLLLGLYVTYPIAFRLLSVVRRNAVFLPYVGWPSGVDFNDTQLYINATRNFYIQTEVGVTIGVWHVLPKSLMDTTYDNDEYERSLSDGFPIVLYLHGITGSRINGHRLELYKRLQAMDYHVIAVDYRGYGDSVSTIPLSEDGVVADAKAVYSYIKKHSGDSKVIVWGHSLGTGVGSRAVSELCIDDDAPYGLLLESPFSNIADAVLNIPWTYIYRPVSYMLPAFHWFFLDSIKEDDLAFQSDHHIKYINCPIVILHAQDDVIIPITLAHKLYNSAVNGRPSQWPSIRFIEFDQSFGYGHKNIYQALELPTIVQDLLQRKSIGKLEKKLISSN